MQSIFSADGEAAMRQCFGSRTLLALDFDGTLAPIVADPAAARAPADTAAVLAALSERMPVAILTGRAVADVSERLGFRPQFIVGNHGAEGLPGIEASASVEEVGFWRERIMNEFRDRLLQAGVMIEDKAHSMSFHYRHAPDRAQALDLIHAAISGLSPAPRVIGGKCVVNLLPVDAPDKFRALSRLLQIAGCDTAIFCGDDLTDDIVFEQAPAHWLTVRVEEIEPAHARFCVSAQTEVVHFLRRLLDISRAGTPPDKQE